MCSRRTVTVCAESSRRPSENAAQSQSIQQPLVPFAKAGLPRADLTLPTPPVMPGQRRQHRAWWQSTLPSNSGTATPIGNSGTARETAGQGNSGTSDNGTRNRESAGKLRRDRNGRASYVGNGRDRNGESRRYQRNRNGQGCLPCPCESQRIALASRLTAITLVWGACAIAERKRIRPTP
jgi:hypothetical protein